MNFWTEKLYSTTPVDSIDMTFLQVINSALIKHRRIQRRRGGGIGMTTLVLSVMNQDKIRQRHFICIFSFTSMYIHIKWLNKNIIFSPQPSKTVCTYTFTRSNTCMLFCTFQGYNSKWKTVGKSHTPLSTYQSTCSIPSDSRSSKCPRWDPLIFTTARIPSALSLTMATPFSALSTLAGNILLLSTRYLQ